jgi:hypothetical protein
MASAVALIGTQTHPLPATGLERHPSTLASDAYRHSLSGLPKIPLLIDKVIIL